MKQKNDILKELYRIQKIDYKKFSEKHYLNIYQLSIHLLDSGVKFKEVVWNGKT